MLPVGRRRQGCSAGVLLRAAPPPSLTSPARGEGFRWSMWAVPERPILEVRVDMLFLGGAGVGHRAFFGVADGLGVAPEGAGLVVVLARLPALAAGRPPGGALRGPAGSLHRVAREGVSAPAMRHLVP